MMRARSVLAPVAAALLSAAPFAYAAIGDLDFQAVDVGISAAGGRPQPPVISATNATGEWRTTDAPVEFRLRVRAKVNAGSRIGLIKIGIPGLQIPKNSWTVFSVPEEVSNREVVVNLTTHRIPSNGLAIPSLTAAGMCAAAHANGATGTFDLNFPIDAEVQVFAARGRPTDERRTRLFNRTVAAKVRCTVVSQSVAGPPQRTPVKPERTALPYMPISAELGFARATNATACPVDIRQSIRIVSRGAGTAKVYILRQDNPGVLGAPIYVPVTTRLPNAHYVGVLRKTVRFTKPFKGTYRVLAVNPFGEPVASPWAVLNVKC